MIAIRQHFIPVTKGYRQDIDCHIIKNGAFRKMIGLASSNLKAFEGLSALPTSFQSTNTVSERYVIMTRAA